MCNRVFCWVDRAVSIGIWAQKSPLFVKPVPWLCRNSFSEIYTIVKQAKIIFTKICKVFLWFNICGGVRLHFKCKVSEEERTWVSQNLEPKNQVLHCSEKNGTVVENESKSYIFHNLHTCNLYSKHKCILNTIWLTWNNYNETFCGYFQTLCQTLFKYSWYAVSIFFSFYFE